MILFTLLLDSQPAMAADCFVYVDATAPACSPSDCSTRTGTLLDPFPDIPEAADQLASGCETSTIVVAPGVYGDDLLQSASSTVDQYQVLLNGTQQNLVTHSLAWDAPSIEWTDDDHDFPDTSDAAWPGIHFQTHSVVRLKRAPGIASDCATSQAVESGDTGDTGEMEREIVGPFEVDGSSKPFCSNRHSLVEGIRVVHSPAAAITAGSTVNVRIAHTDVIRPGLGGVAVLSAFQPTIVKNHIEDANWLGRMREVLTVGDHAFGVVVDGNVVDGSMSVCERGENLDLFFDSIPDWEEAWPCCSGDCYPDITELYASHPSTELYLDPEVEHSYETSAGVGLDTTHDALIVANTIRDIADGGSIYVNSGRGLDSPPGIDDYEERPGLRNIAIVHNVADTARTGGIRIGAEGCGAIDGIVVANNFSINQGSPIHLTGRTASNCEKDTSGNIDPPDMVGIVFVNNTLHGCSYEVGDTGGAEDHRFNAGASCYDADGSATNTTAAGIKIQEPGNDSGAAWLNFPDTGSPSSVEVFNNLASNVHGRVLKFFATDIDDDDDGEVLLPWITCGTNRARVELDTGTDKTYHNECTDMIEEDFDEMFDVDTGWVELGPGFDVTDLTLGSTSDAQGAGSVNNGGSPAKVFAPLIDGLDADIRGTSIDLGADQAD